MSNDTGTGRGPAHGSNENHDSDPRTRTMGEEVPQDEPPAGNDLIDEVAPDLLAACAGQRRTLLTLSSCRLRPTQRAGVRDQNERPARSRRTPC